MTYVTVIMASWVVFILVWIVSAFSVKRDVKGGGIRGAWYRFLPVRLAIAALLVFVATRIATGTAHYASADAVLFRSSLFVPSLALGWAAAALTAFGVLFAIWARFFLGRNWSSHPTHKENHELVTNGPYAYVRHPIYTGMILAALGAALAGTLFGIVAFVVVSIVFYLRIDTEERIMLELFPNEYPAYQKRTKKLVPFVW